ncbi:MAG TPA: ATP-dependent helicase [Melioribacteraceae bacterium]|nr:ATP-dependent helicase [Melioribacteraceae bacterium]
MVPEIFNLSEEQKKILGLNTGKHLILAPPGTGKTELIAQRVLKAVSIDCFPESEIICLTFTNRAARNMLERVKQRVPNSKVFISNLHGFGTQFLIKNQIIPSASSFIDDEDSEELYKEACNIINSNSYRFNDFSKKAFRYKLKLHGLTEYFRKVDVNFSFYELNQIEAYEKLKEESLLYDYDDILVLTLKHLVNYKDEYKFGKFSIIQVDETQDLSEIQWNIVKHIQRTNANVVLFGDIYQSIFGFNGANLELVENFTKEYKRHKLTSNFRSDLEIINMLNEYLEWYFTDKKHSLPIQNFSKDTSNSTNLKFFDWNNLNQEDQYYELKKVLIKYNIKNEQTAFLFYKNDDVESFNDIWQYIYGNVFKVSKYDLFRRGFVKDIFAFLNSIYRPFERISWVRLIKIFGKFKTLKEARIFINSLLNNGILPVDLMKEDLEYTSELTEFKTLLNSGRLIFFDTETSGLDTFNDDIIQISAIEVINGEICSKFNVYIETNKDLTESSKINNISNNFLKKNAVPASEGLMLFNNFVKGDPLVAHNLNFDKSVLINNLKRNNLFNEFNFPLIWFDTIEIIKRILPKLHSYKLSYLIEFLKIDAENTHNAIDDIEATVKVIFTLKKLLSEILDSAEMFILDNMKKLKLFTLNYAPFYNKVKYNNLPVTYRNIIEDFINFSKMEDANLSELIKLLNHMDTKTKPDTISKLLSKHMNFYRRCKTSDLITENDKTIITTIHKAKGLEFDNVIIPDFNIYLFPHNNKDSEERKKLLYVAMSRAKKRLIITSANTYNHSPSIKSQLLKPVEHYFNNKI